MKKLGISILIIMIIFINTVNSTVSLANELSEDSYAISSSEIYSEGAILINATSGQVLFQKNAQKKLYPASTTKILTALIINESYDFDEEIIIDAESPFTIGSRIYVHENEVFTIEQLLNALLIDSANDVANALAVHHSGSIEEFSKAMNKKAKELGAINSNFVNPSGLHDKDHYTTAYDLSQIAKFFYKNSQLMGIVKKPTYSIPPTNKVDETRYLKSSNKFLFSESSNYLLDYRGKQIFAKFDLVNGLKTGYTDEANNCLITSASDGQMSLISVVLNATGRHSYTDSRKLIEYGFYEFNTQNYFKKNDAVKEIEINNFKKSKITLLAKDDISILMDKDYNPNKVTTETIVHDIDLPIKKNITIGEFNIYYDRELLISSPLVSNISVTNDLLLTDQTEYYVEENSINYLSILGVLLRLLIAFIIWRGIITLIRVKFDS